MSVPASIPDVGATSQRLRQNPSFNPLQAGFGTEEYFVWSRFDGSTTLKDLILMTGLSTDRAVAIVQRLWQAGALVGSGREPASTPSVSRTPTPTQGPAISRTATPTQPPLRPRTVTVDTARSPRLSGVTPVPDLIEPTAEERAALAEPGAMSEADRRRVLAGLRLVVAGDPWALLGIARGVDKKQLKRAFFERSKLFHPDRYFGKDVGDYAARLFTIFEALTRAHGELSGEGSPRRRTATGPEATAPQTPAEYAAELFDRACVAEVSGDATQAMKLFAAAVKLDGQARYLRRAAVCALTAGELRTAEDYAKKAAAIDGSDPSTARILGKVLRALGKLDLAEEVLIMALAMKSENDTLMLELTADLRAIRAELAR
jgi:hypothetical protein